jgi:hypothetical protein
VSPSTRTNIGTPAPCPIARLGYIRCRRWKLYQEVRISKTPESRCGKMETLEACSENQHKIEHSDGHTAARVFECRVEHHIFAWRRASDSRQTVITARDEFRGLRGVGKGCVIYIGEHTVRPSALEAGPQAKTDGKGTSCQNAQKGKKMGPTCDSNTAPLPIAVLHPKGGS